jgi:alkaline phosphatase
MICRDQTAVPINLGINHFARFRVSFAVLLLFAVSPHLPLQAAERATNVVLFIGDGMGFEQVRAAKCYKGEALCFELWDSTGLVDTASADSQTTDSAAAATAMATGVRVNNGVISVALPGVGSELQTVLEYFKSKGKRTGLVTTTYMTHATPAAFGAHESSRNNLAQIAGDYLGQTRPNILYGGGGNGLDPATAVSAGYLVVTDRTEMLSFNTALATNVSGQFGTTDLPYEYEGVGSLPHLREMTSNALEVLECEPAGFFLMVEGGRIDHACHSTNITYAIAEILELNEAVKYALTWATNRNDTLIMVTGDHETGGLQVLQDNGPGTNPAVAWTAAGGHTGTNVGFWAWGANNADLAVAISNFHVRSELVNSSLYRSSCGQILEADPTSIRMEWTVSKGDVFRLDYSTELLQPNWQPLTVVTASSSLISITDTNSVLPANRFYRLISLP